MAAEHHDKQHPLSSLDDHTGEITDAQHGSRSGGSAHPPATALDSGFLTPAEKELIGEVAGVARISPGYHTLGSLLDYPESGGANTASYIQYVRVWLLEGWIIDRMTTFITGVAAGKYVKMGIYDQADPSDETLDPRDKVAETAQYEPPTANQFIKRPLLSVYTVPTGGYYWLALITDSVAVKFAATQSYREGYLPRRIEASTGVVLPATAGSLTNPAGSLALVAATEQGY